MNTYTYTELLALNVEAVKANDAAAIAYFGALVAAAKDGLGRGEAFTVSPTTTTAGVFAPYYEK